MYVWTRDVRGGNTCAGGRAVARASMARKAIFVRRKKRVSGIYNEGMNHSRDMVIPPLDRRALLRFRLGRGVP
jgi:hypothetical protein